MRLDQFLTERGYFTTRAKSADAVKKGLVSINGAICVKVSKEVSLSDVIAVSEHLEFVSKGGYKLQKALDEFKIDLSDLIFADIGASTGGFTDCLLRAGVKKVYAVDVGKDLLDKKLKSNNKVVVMDERNARYLKKEDFGEKLDGVTADCSFISLNLLLPVFSDLLDEKGTLLVLIKPQFECGKSNLPKSGILKDVKLRVRVTTDVLNNAKRFGFNTIAISKVPEFKDKNVEYVVYLCKTGKNMTDSEISEFLSR